VEANLTATTDRYSFSSISILIKFIINNPQLLITMVLRQFLPLTFVLTLNISEGKNRTQSPETLATILKLIDAYVIWIYIKFFPDMNTKHIPVR
jgi:hypothetical protein